MNLPTITMSKEAAQVAYKQYVGLAKKTDEDHEIIRGLRQLAKGTPLINLQEAIAAGGFDEKGRPLLAVCRADFKICDMERSGDSIRFSKGRDRGQWREIRSGITRIQLPSSEERHVRCSARAIVPIIPAHLRPTIKLENYHILWEAEWTRIPPRDPALLRHVTGDLYALLAVWDLTELEMAAISKRAS